MDDVRSRAKRRSIRPSTTPRSSPTSSRPGRSGLPACRRGFELSPINIRRWQNFKANRRGYWSLWIFLVLFVVSLFAEFIANDKPLYVRYDGKSYFPIVFTYPETAFGGDFETAADYRDPYLQKLIADKSGFMIWPPIRYSYNTHQSRSADAGAVAADLDADRSRNASRWSSASTSTAAATSNTTGSAPTTRAATCWRA